MSTIPNRPSSKSPVEKFYAMLKQMLRTMCSERPNNWDKYLPVLLFRVREIPQESLAFFPIWTVIVRGPIQILRELWSVEETDERALLTYQYVVELKECLETDTLWA